MTCPSCGAPMRLEADRDFFTCDYCGTFYFPEPNVDGIRVLNEPTSLNCPLCDKPLVHAAIGGNRLQYCSQCRGMLVSMVNFLAIIQDLRAHREKISINPRPPDWNDLRRRIRCPQCGQSMDTHPYGGGGNVIIDDCEHCSLNWLDYGELDKIVRAPDHDYGLDSV